ncbi:MAG: hypothetical protein IKM05_08565, partial [Clostridia bacterium]|nr:hypothetical protein [Clostridia bacterium]
HTIPVNEPYRRASCHAFREAASRKRQDIRNELLLPVDLCAKMGGPPSPAMPEKQCSISSSHFHPNKQKF